MAHEILGWLERWVLNVAGEAERSQRQNSVPFDDLLDPFETKSANLWVTLHRRPPFPGRSTASAVFFGRSCILSLVDVKIGASFL